MTTKGYTPSTLITAIQAGSLHGVMNALAAGADIELPDMHGFGGLPLRTASFAGNLAIVRELLNHGANPNADASDGPGAPLRLALRKSHQDIVNLLLEVGAVIPEGLVIQAQKLDLPGATLPEEATPQTTAESKADKNTAFPTTELSLPTDDVDDLDNIDNFSTETRLLSMDLLFFDEHDAEAKAPPRKDKP